ncbi:lipopolysaccharide transport periplasmic protein LptA [Spongorhabdus nitratireducens]
MKSSSQRHNGQSKWQKMTGHYGCALLSALMLAFTSTSWALPSDRSEPIRIASDSADIDDKTGTATYRGNVVMTQGTTRLTGDVVTIKSENREVVEVTAVGKPAHYREQQEGEQGEMKSWGNTIHYYVAQEKVVLLENARVEQKTDEVRGKRIDYDMKTQRINARSQRGSSGDDRVIMEFQPKTAPATLPKG